MILWIPKRNTDVHREMEEKARQPETKLGAIAQTRHTKEEYILQDAAEVDERVHSIAVAS
jgi:hypothetical protein